MGRILLGSSTQPLLNSVSMLSFANGRTQGCRENGTNLAQIGLLVYPKKMELLSVLCLVRIFTALPKGCPVTTPVKITESSENDCTSLNAALLSLVA